MRPIGVGLLSLALLGGFSIYPAWAERPRHVNIGERAEAKRAQALLDKAVAHLKEKGDDALPDFTAKGDFADGEYYVFVVSTKGKMLASGGSSKLLIGQDVRALNDVSGKPFMRELLAGANSQGAGVVEYRWLNPVDGKIELKNTLYRKIGDRIVAVGYYLPRSSPEEAKAMLELAVNAVMKNGSAAFNEFNNPKGDFVQDDLYVFVIGLDDEKFHAHGATPSLTGTPAAELRDAAGKPLIKEMLALARSKGFGEVRYLWRNPVTNRVEDKHSTIKKVDNYLLGVGYYTK